MSELSLMPKLSDVIAAGLAAAASMAIGGMGTPANSAMEQFVSQLVGRVGAHYVDSTDVMTSTNGTVGEEDFYIGAARGAYSLSQKRSNNRVLMEGVKGVLCSVAGKELRKSIGTTTTA